MKLGNQQSKAFNKIIKFLKSDSITFSLEGYAGTGKSFLIKHIIKYLELNNKPYVLTAPTHKASLVLKQFTERDVITLHKLLTLSPNLNILELDFKELQFFINNKSSTEIPYEGLVICDEASMINDDLYNFILNALVKRKCKILFVSDSKQLQPVNNNDLSLVYKVKDKFELTEVFRQNEKCSYFNILKKLRIEDINNFETIESEYGSLYVIEDPQEFIDIAINDFKTHTDILRCKVISYTNQRVEVFNKIINKLIFDDNNKYHNGTILTAYENQEIMGKRIYNSMDYKIISEIEEGIISIPNICSAPIFKFTILDELDNVKIPIVILDESKITEKQLDFIAKRLDKLRVDAINSTNKNKSKSWKKYYEAFNSFLSPIDLIFEGRVVRKKSLDLGYAITIHKIQGSTLDNVYVDIKSINFCRNPLEKRQLKYVALSRAKNNIYIYNA